MLLWLLAGTAVTNAQVKIGEISGPHSGAVLELKSDSKGLLLSKVALTNVNTFTLDEAGSDTAATAIGMVVYNTNKNIIGGKGIGTYVWDGAKWMLIGESDKTYLPIRVTDITVSGADNVDVAGTINMSAAVLPADASNPSVLWTVSNGSGAATIDPLGGILTGVRPGSVYVYATAMDGSGVSGQKMVVVDAIPVTGSTSSAAPR